MGSVIVVHGLSRPTASGILIPWPGIKPVFPALADRFLTTWPPRKSLLSGIYSCMHTNRWNIYKNQAPGIRHWAKWDPCPRGSHMRGKRQETDEWTGQFQWRKQIRKMIEGEWRSVGDLGLHGYGESFSLVTFKLRPQTWTKQRSLQKGGSNCMLRDHC